MTLICQTINKSISHISINQSINQFLGDFFAFSGYPFIHASEVTTIWRYKDMHIIIIIIIIALCPLRLTDYFITLY